MTFSAQDRLGIRMDSKAAIARITTLIEPCWTFPAARIRLGD